MVGLKEAVYLSSLSNGDNFQLAGSVTNCCRSFQTKTSSQEQIHIETVSEYVRVIQSREKWKTCNL